MGFAFINTVYCLVCLCLTLILSFQPWRVCLMVGVAEWGPSFSRCSPSKHSSPPPRQRTQKLNIIFGPCVSETSQSDIWPSKLFHSGNTANTSVQPVSRAACCLWPASISTGHSHPVVEGAVSLSWNHRGIMQSFLIQPQGLRAVHTSPHSLLSSCKLHWSIYWEMWCFSPPNVVYPLREWCCFLAIG